MNRRKIIGLSAMAIAILMVLFPPWSVRERKFSAAFEPDHAGGYAFIASPPNAARSSGWTTAVATVDMSRLLLQFVALALVTGGTIVVTGMSSRKEAHGERLLREGAARASSAGAAAAVSGGTLGPMLTERERVCSSRPPAGTPANDLARRWTWERLAKWTYNWYLLLGIWVVMGLLSTLGEWGEFQDEVKRISVSPQAQNLALADVAFTLILLALFFVAQCMMKRRISNAAALVQVLLVMRCIANGLEFVAIKSIFLASIAINAATPPLIGSTFWCLVCLLFTLPLRNRRFSAFSKMLNYLAYHGVPARFVASASSNDEAVPAFDPAQPHIVQPDERRIRYGWSKLVRAILAGKVSIPENVRFATAGKVPGRVAA